MRGAKKLQETAGQTLARRVDEVLKRAMESRSVVSERMDLWDQAAILRESQEEWAYLEGQRACLEYRIMTEGRERDLLTTTEAVEGAIRAVNRRLSAKSAAAMKARERMISALESQLRLHRFVLSMQFQPEGIAEVFDPKAKALLREASGARPQACSAPPAPAETALPSHFQGASR